jgi:hypothetical protein
MLIWDGEIAIYWHNFLSHSNVSYEADVLNPVPHFNVKTTFQFYNRFSIYNRYVMYNCFPTPSQLLFNPKLSSNLTTHLNSLLDFNPTNHLVWSVIQLLLNFVSYLIFISSTSTTATSSSSLFLPSKYSKSFPRHRCRWPATYFHMCHEADSHSPSSDYGSLFSSQPPVA